MAFHFKQFSVEDDQSTMKIGTDAVLLGTWANPMEVKSILEIGTGCGVIALMLAQKSKAIIDAIDLDEASIRQARENFQESPWPDRIHPQCASLQEFCNETSSRYGMIVTNPPFFMDSMQSPDEKINRAKHTNLLSRKDLIEGVRNLMETDGVFLVILPDERNRNFYLLAESAGLYLTRQMKVRPRSDKPINRILSEFSLQPCALPVDEEIVIRNKDNSFTKEYLKFTGPYYFSLG
jgi:tRNA1Val (adenine37-N6)-methyltransferase